MCKHFLDNITPFMQNVVKRIRITKTRTYIETISFTRLYNSFLKRHTLVRFIILFVSDKSYSLKEIVTLKVALCCHLFV